MGSTRKKDVYRDDLLITSINPDINMYVLFFYKDIKSKGSAPYLSKELLKTVKLYKNIEEFKERLVEYMRKSTEIKDETDGLTENQISELKMTNRLIKWCDDRDMEYIPNENGGTAIDGFLQINGLIYRVQLKSSSSITDKLFNFHLHRRRSEICPYSVEDNVEIFVFEISTEKYQGDFYIIPVSKLIERGYIKTDAQKGKIQIGLASRDYTSHPKLPKNSRTGVKYICLYKKGFRVEYKNKTSLYFETIEEAQEKLDSLMKKDPLVNIPHWSLEYLNKVP